MANPSWFNEAYYLNSKLAQLQASGQTQYTNVGQVYAAIVAAGQTPYENYTQYSLVELTDPNQYFDTTEYLEAKAVEMGLPQTDWSYVSVALQQAGFTNAYAHYHQFGWLEGVNPNNDFDTVTYITDLAELNGITYEQAEAALLSSGLDPIEHYYQYGQEEGLVPSPATDPVDPPVGETYTLTTGVDTIVGTAGNDTVNGTLTGTAASTTLNVFDSINGAAGTNTLNVNFANTVGTVTAANVPTLQNIQVVNLNSLAGDGAAANTMNGAMAPQMTTLNIASPVLDGGAAGATFGLSNGSAALTTFGLSSIAADDFDVTYTSASGVFGGTADAVSLNLSTVGGAAAQTTTDGPVVAFVGGAVGQGVEVINIAGTGANRLANLTAADSAGTQTVTTVNVSGTGSVGVDGDLNFKGTARGVINASTNTGGVTFTATNEDITFTGGSGDDRLNLGSTLSAGDIIDFGTGTNTLGLTNTTISSSLYSLINATEAERIAFYGTGITADLSQLTSSVVVVDNTGNTNTFNHLAAGDLVELSTIVQTGTVNLTATLGYNTANVKFAGSSTTDVTLTTLNTTNQTTVNIESVGASGDGNEITTFTNTANTAINVTGSGTGLALGTLAASAALDATGYTGLTFSVTGADEASIFTTGSAVDTITLGTLAGGDVVDSGAGNDTIVTAAVDDVEETEITGGLGADAINVTASDAVVGLITLNTTATDSYATAGKSDTVTVAVSGAGDDYVITVDTGLLSTSLTAATSVNIGTTEVTTGGFLWVNATGSVAAQDEAAVLYQDSNQNGIIDASDLQINFAQAGADTFAISIVGSQATIAFNGEA
jgi:hypothetical protein